MTKNLPATIVTVARKAAKVTIRTRLKSDRFKRAPIIRTWSDDWIVADNFAGGGGASSGIELAIGRSPDIAVNHCAEAIAVHRANHPSTRHFRENVWKVDPKKATGGKPVGFAWFSPTCTFFSKARGGPLSAEAVKIRGLAWVAIRWAAAVKPRVIAIENVSEFRKWGPLHRDHTHGCKGVICKKGCRFGKRTKGRKIKKHLAGCKGKACRKSCRIHKPIKGREGELYNAFIAKLGRYYKHVEARQLRACDFGAPTTRERLFVLASDEPITWPTPSHGPKRAAPFRTAAQCIDWDVPAPSIFDRDKPLADKTLARIARGIRKFVLDNPRPFIVPPAYGDKGGTDVRVNDIDKPMPTVCGRRGGHAVITPTFVKAVPYLVHRSNGERKGQAPRIYDINEPLRTVVGTDKYAKCVALLIKHNGGNNDLHGSSGQDMGVPVHAVTATDSKALTVAHLVRYNGERREGEAPRGGQLELPLSTVDTSNRFGIVASHLIKMRGTSDAHVTSSASSMEDPVPTVSAMGTHIAQVSAFLVRYNGKSTGQEASEPIGTVDTTDRYALVTVTIDGEEYVLADIGMRMLSPRELFRAQGFREDYKISPMFKGKKLSKTAQIRMVGNSVCPPLAAAIVRAQFGLDGATGDAGDADFAEAA